MKYPEDYINKIICIDCLTAMKDIPDMSIDSIVTDPPYGIRFMNKRWDYDLPKTEVWQECLRVLKPGGHLLSAGGTKTYHRMAVAVEDAGFSIRDCIGWVYGSGMPKGLNIGKQEGCEEWAGWGTALKPAMELWALGRKPLAEKTVSENILKYRTGGINIDGCRIMLNGEKPPTDSEKRVFKANQYTEEKIYGENKETSLNGRWPANFIHDGSNEVVNLFPYQESGARSAKHHIGNEKGESYNHGIYGTCKAKKYDDHPAEEGSAARFFYVAKASKNERNRGCEQLEERKSELNTGGLGRKCSVEKRLQHDNINATQMKNYHPTVKPISLMRYLCRLITPIKGIVLDPFAGSGSTLCAAQEERFKYIGIEISEEYCRIANARLRQEILL